jgi:hypothetical protein
MVVGAWTHSHEEDRGDYRVYRPSEGDFPPARGRDTFTLRPGGVLEQVVPGPDDRPVTRSGTWHLQDGRLSLQPSGSSAVHLIVQAVDDDQLIVREPAGDT